MLSFQEARDECMEDDEVGYFLLEIYCVTLDEFCEPTDTQKLKI